ncbi:hypothetical protein EZV62_025719 [Acer yangbiense]|uniref:Mitochondrial glycoprotein domain-containing protein n=1 Tax=Acer yangbiense TaxID=1000413 RepID=A0A5C7GYL3_9ROSI|nr:hypothetical protein EZV62_025719 [Acer yangbiense]
MAFCTILRKSASFLAPTASRLARANRNYHSAVFFASSHLNQKPPLGSFVHDFESSSATETKKRSSNIESLLQAIDSEIKRADDNDRVEETLSEFTLKIEDTSCGYNAVLTREYQDELVEVSSHIYRSEIGKDRKHLYVTISNNDGSSLEFSCLHTSDAISILEMTIIYSENSRDHVAFSGLNENQKKTFSEFVEIRGIKPSLVDFLIKRISNKNTERRLMELKNIKNFIKQLA